MSDLKTRLIETAVRPFHDNAEMEMAAKNLLGDLASPDGEGAEEAIARWEAVDGRKRRAVWRWVLFSVLVIVSAVIWMDGVKAVMNSQKFFGSPVIDIFYGDLGASSGRIPRNLTDGQRLLLYVDSTEGSKSEKTKALWDSDPTNPAYFAEYAACYLLEHGETLPPDFLETARRIDPQNAWFTYLAAGVKAKDAVKMRKQTAAEKAANKTPEWDVLDEPKFADALAILRQARDQPKCGSYEMELLRQQLQLLPGRTPPELMRQIIYIFDRSNSLEISILALAEVIAAQARLNEETNDLPGLRELLVDADGFLQKRTSSEVGSLLREFMNQGSTSRIVSNLSPAAEKLGFTEESARLREIFGRVLELKARKASKKRSPSRDLLYEKGSELAGWFGTSASPSLKNPPVLTDDELRPGRLVDHEVLSRFCCYISWSVLMVAMGLVAAFRYRIPVLIRRLAGRMESLMRPSDWAWILAGGVLLPFFYVMAVIRLTPWGGRELSLGYSIPSFYSYSEQLEFSQFAGLAALIILLSVSITRWRLAKRAAVFGFRQKREWLGWTMIVCALAFVPILGWAVTRPSEPGVYVAFFVAAVPIFWLLATSVRSLYSKPEDLLHYCLIARTLVPTYAVAAILMMATVPYFKAAAYHWFEQDQLMKPDLAHSSLTKFEYQVALQMRKELREILGYETSPHEK
ncbi:MAG: hypothetical protein ABIS50_26555 [Luteolibacter sp.]|uniref:hypothetical protein n=1 Tax=Luteolibacter sp. TaxID=1962973 RepID=UPI0032647D09